MKNAQTNIGRKRRNTATQVIDLRKGQRIAVNTVLDGWWPEMDSVLNRQAIEIEAAKEAGRRDQKGLWPVCCDTDMAVMLLYRKIKNEQLWSPVFHCAECNGGAT